jgi:hypothetical protein
MMGSTATENAPQRKRAEMPLVGCTLAAICTSSSPILIVPFRSLEIEMEADIFGPNRLT